MPFDADVLIAGAGPAGCAAAIRLARAARKVVLCDRSRFPRDKACGDGLIADSIAALKALGLDGAVANAAHHTTGALTSSPGGRQVPFSTTDSALARAARDAPAIDGA